MARFVCAWCSRETESDSLAPVCPACGSQLLLERRHGPFPSRAELEGLPPGVWRYRDFLPSVEEGTAVTLGEGGTPLLRAERLGKEIGLKNLYLKDESRNPTGSFMDRGSTVLITLAKGAGVKECACTTSGNLGASLAAYCARATMGARLRLQPNTDQGKLYQMLAYGAEIDTISGPYLRDRTTGVLEVSPANPYLLEGEKTTGFELVHDLGWDPPDVVVVPVGTGGHLAMTWRAMAELREAGLADGRPSRLFGVGLKEKSPGRGAGRRRDSVPPLAELEQTDRVLLREATRAISESRGGYLATTPEETLKATGLLARTEGIFAEPSSASVVASLREAVKQGDIGRDERVVCVVTGAGLKDPRAVSRLAREVRKASPEEARMLITSPIGRTKVEILRLIGTRGGYGYEVWRLLRSRREISTASVYQHLAELEASGLVRRGGSVEAKGRERVLYELTKRGADLLRVAERLGEE